jgi:hypothetical protein
LRVRAAVAVEKDWLPSTKLLQGELFASIFAIILVEENQ